METFLTCRALATYLKENTIGEERGALVENAALNAIYKTIFANISLADVKLLLNELPNILPLNYPVVENIRKGCLDILSNLKTKLQRGIDNKDKIIFWRDFNEFDNLLRMLQVFDSYSHK